MTIRPLTEISEFVKCVDLQRAAWGTRDIDLMPVRLFVTQSRIGGLVLGAFDGERLVGFVNTTPGLRQGMPYWYSQMLGIAADYWNRGIASQLKLAQRDQARLHGIRLIEWTFDPLESKNAYLNINKLGVMVRRYHVNLYGATTSRLQEGLESDRVIAEWWIDRPRAALDGGIRRLFIPADIQALKKRSQKSAQEEQLRVRKHFLENLADDFFVAGFERNGDSSEYLFVRGASIVYPAD